jgi:hypothetical protein
MTTTTPHDQLIQAIVTDWFDTLRSMSGSNAREFFAGLVTPALTATSIDELEQMAADAGLEYCSECYAPLDDGEGYDGLCGTHADLAEQQGRWS